MVLLQTVLQWAAVSTNLFSKTPQASPQATKDRRIAIVGAGPGGLGVLKAIHDLPSEVRSHWTIDVYEQRHDVGGMWLPDPAPQGPELPETPLYPRLTTNTPIPTMSYPLTPFKSGTPLYPLHGHALQYLKDVASSLNSTGRVYLSHRVEQALFDSHSLLPWTLHLYDHSRTRKESVIRQYHHLIVASGSNHYPYIPSLLGKQEWLDAAPTRRSITHAIWYREPEKYIGHTVIVVGAAASGTDIAIQVLPYAKELYHSHDTNSSHPVTRPPIPGAIQKPRIANFTSASINFVDGSSLDTPTNTTTTILLGTGYQLLIPFLRSVLEHPADNEHVSGEKGRLVTNARYIRPLFRHILALDSRLPPTALSFVGLPEWISHWPSAYAQGLFIAHSIADPNILPSRGDMLHELEEDEERLRGLGIDPERNGHRFPIAGSAEDYQDDLINYLRDHSSISLPKFLQDVTRPYVDPWRRRVRDEFLSLKECWRKAEAQGIAEEFVRDAESEDDWVNVMQRVKEWAQDQGYQT